MPTPSADPPASTILDAYQALQDRIWRAPLAPVALACTAGIILDRYFQPPLAFSLIGVLAGLLAWAGARPGARPGLGLLYLFTSLTALGAAYHHWHRASAADDVAHYAAPEPRPVHVRGRVVDEPVAAAPQEQPELRSYISAEPRLGVLKLESIRMAEAWRPLTGRVRLIMPAEVVGVHAGDDVDVHGQLSAPRLPMNPGEFDEASYLRDQGIHGVLRVQRTQEAVVTRGSGWWTPARLLAVVRGWGVATLRRHLTDPQAGLAAALLLGERSALAHSDWEAYRRTGVVHVLVISGQHLMVLGGFLWLAVRVLGMRRRRSAWLVGLFLLFYALLTGGRPPALRAAILISVFCGGILLRRTALVANSLALAWLVVILLNPADVFQAGCQLSFLAVSVLYWGTGPLARRWLEPRDELAELVAASRPYWQRGLLFLGSRITLTYAVTAVLWLVMSPLVASRYHLFAPIAILIGPPMLLLTSIALLSGFLLLLASAVSLPGVSILAALTNVSLSACDGLVGVALRLPGHRYVAGFPGWWLWVFYLGVLLFLFVAPLRRQALRVAVAAAAWLLIGLFLPAPGRDGRELRCTFLAVGHGCCIVIETPEGRTLVYDAGAITGPEVTRRQIGPFLWQRGIQRIDEIFLSHADIDHFNGLPDLLDRFPVGQVSYTPTFADRNTPAVAATRAALERDGIPLRVLTAGTRLTSGSVDLEVLHPPAQGPAGRENVRSLVLLLHHAGNTMLLTGDLEEAGLDQLLSRPPPPVDVLMAPHHGSSAANTPALAAWARPGVVIACQGPPRWPTRQRDPYTPLGVRYLGTWPHGAITLRSQSGTLSLKTFRTGQSLSVR